MMNFEIYLMRGAMHIMQPASLFIFLVIHLHLNKIFTSEFVSTLSRKELPLFLLPWADHSIACKYESGYLRRPVTSNVAKHNTP